MHRRTLLALGAAGLASHAMAQSAAPPSWNLKRLPGPQIPISPEVRQARVARAQALMRRQGLSALIIEPGSSLVYFTGVRWSRSERVTCAILPVEGEIGEEDNRLR